MEQSNNQVTNAEALRNLTAVGFIRMLSTEEIALIGGGEIGIDEYPLPKR